MREPVSTSQYTDNTAGVGIRPEEASKIFFELQSSVTVFQIDAGHLDRYTDSAEMELDKRKEDLRVRAQVLVNA
jgi:hypothetical protein